MRAEGRESSYTKETQSRLLWHGESRERSLLALVVFNDITHPSEGRVLNAREQAPGDREGPGDNYKRWRNLPRHLRQQNDTGGRGARMKMRNPPTTSRNIHKVCQCRTPRAAQALHVSLCLSATADVPPLTFSLFVPRRNENRQICSQYQGARLTHQPTGAIKALRPTVILPFWERETSVATDA